MATEHTEGESDGGGATLQEQFLEALQLTQEVTQQFVTAWFDGTVELVSQMAELTKVPAFGALPEPAQLFALAQKMVNTQQLFIQDTVSQSDPISFLSSLKAAQSALLHKPNEIAAANARLAIGLDAAVRATIQCAAGKSVSAPLSPDAGDKRFADPAYKENPLFFLLEQQYLLGCQFLTELLDAAELDGAEDAKARFAATFILDALAPTNSLLGNPAALREALDTGGESLVRGAQNMMDDIQNHGGWPSQVDTTGFEVGVNMAATPGAVVFRNELIELIQYRPQTAQVFEVPLLFCPPWINKYYIMDLVPGKSLIEWAVQHGHQCFAISYRNPDSSMRDFGLEDYLDKGLFDAVRVIKEITGAPEVNTVSLCLGGTLTAMGLAYNAAVGDTSIKSSTFLNTNTDFSIPGALGIFTDESTIAEMEEQMDKDGYLEADQMSHVFDVLRANDLIFQYVGNNWLQGKSAPAFDLLVWNGDSTRMPAKMHSQYLRSCYLNNEYSRGEFVIKGKKLDPKKVTVDTYVVAAINDHIVLWASSYKTAQMFSGPNRFVLSTAGHIAGVVNPPSPKAKFWTSDERPVDPLDWKLGAETVDDTWWNDWTQWIKAEGGNEVPAPTSLGTIEHPALEAAPGKYVFNYA
jgi:polyhydroxyalkanoate synthase